MPMVQCKDCGGLVSTMARTCPRCGRPIALGRAVHRSTYVLLGLLFGGLGLHNFYAGRTSLAWGQLLFTLALCWTVIVPVVAWLYAFGEVCSVRDDAFGNRML